jgi:hypothetical protein
VDHKPVQQAEAERPIEREEFPKQRGKKPLVSFYVHTYEIGLTP